MTAELARFDGIVHGFIWMDGVAACGARELAASALRRALHPDG